MKKKKLAYLALFSVLGALWRRWFGMGGSKLGEIPRIFKYLALALIVVGMYFVKDALDWQNWRLYAVIASFMLFWAIGHGTWFKYWDNSDFAEGRLPLLDKFIWFCIGVDESRTFWGNAFGMFCRYELTSIPVAFFLPNAWFLLAGVLVSLSYAVAGMKKNTEIGEYLAGGTVFSLLFFCI